MAGDAADDMYDAAMLEEAFRAEQVPCPNPKCLWMLLPDDGECSHCGAIYDPETEQNDG